MEQLDEELERIQVLSQIEQKLKRKGTNSSIIIKDGSDRSFLDMITIPRRLAIEAGCCRVATTYYVLLFTICIFDGFNLVRYFMMAIEACVYQLNYPEVVAAQVYLKGILAAFILVLEILAVKMQWNFLKGAYALKLFQIVFCICEVLIDRTPQEVQCNKWLNTKEHNIPRDPSKASNSFKPMSQLFFCNFERVHEDFSKRDTEDTVKYFQFNYTIQNVLVSLEVVYCFICMLIFLLIVYWI